MEQAIIRIFEENQRVYGAKMIQAKLHEEGLKVSRKRRKPVLYRSSAV
ncbi:IS3 family transposase [Brevibacillus ruminantium]|uniref:IS3 family transposase n=1 Tax=Brevibacillus ruminantium TaxID=2950604 RepID=A0ABY4WE02_9BACL|nr:IS3 family transposase [Brevibacillus ruminantium]USG64979.1 IS3 family transposase [Brevibacillus ruminantium]